MNATTRRRNVPTRIPVYEIWVGTEPTGQKAYDRALADRLASYTPGARVATFYETDTVGGAR